MLKASEEESYLEKIEVSKQNGPDFGENDNEKKDSYEHMLQE